MVMSLEIGVCVSMVCICDANELFCKEVYVFGDGWWCFVVFTVFKGVVCSRLAVKCYINYSCVVVGHIRGRAQVGAEAHVCVCTIQEVVLSFAVFPVLLLQTIGCNSPLNLLLASVGRCTCTQKQHNIIPTTTWCTSPSCTR